MLSYRHVRLAPIEFARRPLRRRCWLPRCLLTATVVVTIFGPSGRAAEWDQFRGPRGTGVSEDLVAPVTFGPNVNFAWKSAVPAGKSSPVFADKKVFLTGHEDERLITLAMDAETGEVLWRREVEQRHETKRNALNDAAAPTPVTDGESVYALFVDFGVVSYTLDGEERWRLPIPRTEVMHGVSASPVIYDGIVVIVIDQKQGSYVLGIDAAHGSEIWRTERPDTFGGVYCSPVVYSPPGQPAQLLTLADGAIVSYSFKSGERLWWIGGLPIQPRSTPTHRNGVIFVSVRGLETVAIPSWKDVLQRGDKNGNSRLEFQEKPPLISDQGFSGVDTNDDGAVDVAEWSRFRRLITDGILLAIRPTVRGDVRDASVLWTFSRALQAVSSPLVYRDAVYFMRNGGILVSVEAATGELLKKERLRGALGTYYSSPIAAAGKIYVASQEGKLAVVEAGRDWTLLSVSDFGEEIYATPAVVDGRLYVRTESALYCSKRKE